MAEEKTDKNIQISVRSPSKAAPDDNTIIQPKNRGEEVAAPKLQYEPPYLVVVEGPRTGARFPLGEGPNVIGRSQGNAVRLEDQSVSRQHAELLKGESGWTVKDMGSKNGTFVNGQPVAETVVIGHKDIVKTGIYFLRLITQPTRFEEEMTLPAELVMADRTIFVAAPPDSLTSAMRKKDVPDGPEAEERAEGEREIPASPKAEEEPAPKGGRFGKLKLKNLKLDKLKLGELKKMDKMKLLKLAGFGIVGFIVMIAVAYFAIQSTFKAYKGVAPGPEAAETETAKEPEVTQALPGVTEDIPPPPQEAPSPDMQGAPPMTEPPQGEQQGTVSPIAEAPLSPPPAAPPPAVPPTTSPETQPAAPPAGQPAAQPSPVTQPAQAPQVPPAQPVQTIPVFLDIASSPMPARITFRGQEIGATPMRINVDLEPARVYQMDALFVLADIGQQHRQSVTFTVESDKSVIPILFRAPIGILKVNDLPRDTQFYLEGKYSYDKFQEQTVKLQQIILQKPIYIPYGNYFMELRRSRQMGESSQTFVTDIVFRRDFTIAEDSPTYLISVQDEDLKFFPARIKSDPPNAQVFIDGQLLGRTPFEGSFPIGEHKLALRKEGYFEHSEDLDVDINTPYVADIKLKTSMAGLHINNARLAMSRNMYQEAVNELAEALNTQPTPSEVGLTNHLIGRCYLNLGDVPRAMDYFDKARADETQKYPAMLGLANGYALLQQPDKSLPLLVEVMLKNKDEEVKKEAHSLFQKISPFRSVVYVYTDPPGAKVVVNDKPVAQATPVILHELPLGTYRIHIEKTGYLPTDLNLSLSVNEFNPVIVKLKPVPQ